MHADMPKLGKLPTIRRLPAYLRLLHDLRDAGQESVSGTYFAEQLKLDPVQVRKDLTITGIVGKPRIGFSVCGLITAIEEYLGWNNSTEVFLVGVGHLGTALLGYSGFTRHGLNIIAAFDTNPVKIGQEVHGKTVFALEKLPNLAQRLKVHIAIVTVPAVAVQSLADLLIDAGITAIWNFTPAPLRVPAGIIVQNEDLSSGLAILCRRVRDANAPHPPTLSLAADLAGEAE